MCHVQRGITSNVKLVLCHVQRGINVKLVIVSCTEGVLMGSWYGVMYRGSINGKLVIVPCTEGVLMGNWLLCHVQRGY